MLNKFYSDITDNYFFLIKLNYFKFIGFVPN